MPRGLAWAAVLVATLALAVGGDSWADDAPGAAASRVLPRAEVNARCETCHEEIAAEWRASLHRRSYTDPVFQAALAIEPSPFCRGCHAPEGDPTAVSESAAELGVGCVTCHLRGGEVVGARALAANQEHHAVQLDPRFGGVEACASCHQFDFPDHPGAAMQSTVEEHAVSKFAQQSCPSCHMPSTTGDRGVSHLRHDFRVQGDATMLASAVDVRARRGAYGTVEVVLTPARVGHAFPTGDMFRHLVVRATARDRQGKIVMSAAPLVLGRRFTVTRSQGGALDRLPVGDDRVPPPRPGLGLGDERVATLRFPDAIDGLEVSWEVAYRRVDPVLGAALGISADADETLIAKGALRAR